MAAIHLSGSPFAVRALLGCAIIALGLHAGPAIAGCNSGNAANTDQLSSANCQATATGLGAVAIGSTATTGLNGDAVAVGFNAQAGDGGAIAQGANSLASGLNSVAIGREARATALRAVAISGGDDGDASDARATAVDAVAIGGGTRAAGVRSLAVGRGSAANGQDSVAIGTGATAMQAGSIAIGNGATAVSSVAIGTGAQATGTTTTAIGDNAIASGNNSVAIGNASIANQANTVSVGQAGQERRITNVAPGVSGTDAVNVNQLNAVAVGGAAPLIDQLVSRMDSLETRLDEVARNSNRGIAGVAAMAGAVPTTPGKTTLNLGLGAYQGESAIGASVAHLTSSGRFNLNGGVSFSGGKSVARVGAGITF